MRHQYLIFSLFLSILLSIGAVSVLAQAIRYVKPTATGTGDGLSWVNASGYLQAIINASTSGDQVWVANGLYKPTTGSDRTISFAMKNGVAIYGSFAGTEALLTERTLTSPLTTTLSGDIGAAGNADNSYHVFRNSAGLTNSAILDGFVITGGNTNGSPDIDGPQLSSSGGGMSNNGSGSAQVCSPLIRNCSFQGNTAGFGGAMFNYGYLGGNSNPLIDNCTFQGNTAGFGGVMYNYGYLGTSSPGLINCSFQENTAAVGGAIYTWGDLGTSNPSLINCSFQGNTATVGGAMFNDNSSPSLTNCVLFGNGGKNTFSNIKSSVSASYSLFDILVTGYTGGPGNLMETFSPFASNTSTQLNACAPAINAGLNLANTRPTDLAGLPRLVGTVIDMGAFEFQRTPNTGITVQPATGSAVCVGGAVTASVSVSGTEPYIYQWYKGTTSLGAAQSGSALTLSNLTTADADSYSVVVTWSCNSVTSTAFSLTVNALPTGASLTDAGPMAGTLTCSQTSLTLTASAKGGSSYTFSAGAVQMGSTNQAVVSSAGTYSVIIANISGCTATASTTVFSSTAVPTATLTASNTVFCLGNSVTLTAGTGITYAFSGPGFIQNTASPTAVVSQGGTYSVVVSGGNGCTASAGISLTQIAATATVLSMPTASSVICAGGLVIVPVTVTGSANAFQWYKNGVPVDGQTSATLALGNVQATQAGSYVLGVTGGCTSATSSAFALTVNLLPVVTLNFLNSNTALQATGGVFYERMCVLDRVNGYEIRQLDSTSTGFFPIKRVGGFTLTVTGANGCKAVVESTVP